MRTDGSYWLKPTNAQSVDQIAVNGVKSASMDGVRLNPNDRIVFGTHSVFLFKNPESQEHPSLEDSEENPISWEQA